MRYIDKQQRAVFRRLLRQVPKPSAHAAALDIGCGAGRWTRFVRDAGYAATGIDLQSGLIEKNACRDPDITYEVSGVQEFEADRSFDLISSVMVLQHITAEEQPVVIARLHEMLERGGHAVVLENVTIDAPHFFPHSVDDWKALFTGQGFEVVDWRPFNYEPVVGALRRLRPSAGPSEAASAKPRSDAASNGGAVAAVLRMSTALDGALQPLLVRTRPPLRATHCGLLLRKP